MYPGGPNPTQVQYVPAGKAANPPPPLVLIHDGGGTTFSYFILGSLARDVWAVHNPRYFDGVPWEGGMDEMARTYLGYLADEGLSGPIILGGWSLGGYLSLTMAHMIALDPDAHPVSVAGILIIDSPYHIARSSITQPVSKARLTNIPDLVQKSFDNCDAMLRNWHLPRWSGGEAREADYFAVGGRDFKLGPSEVLHIPAAGGAGTWSTISTEKQGTGSANASANASAGESSGLAPGSPPPAVLVRCTRAARPVAEAQDVAAPCLVDLFRGERLLGWEGRYAEFIKAVVEVDADHYGLFNRADAARMDDVTARLGWGLEMLDGLSGKSRAKEEKGGKKTSCWFR
ncbi:hypothetical protein C2857_006820 [Epichloe festucae Fl1]|uniref:Thioesterase domain-containing protein n=1 Tax=Epichloe festucae (strain Fl1) TaxID=877507 RepID=A0A7S9KQA7_EPIFF|nr:hypothetical protein C2857_006820 [Epichloe festucae Fl1]